MSQAPHPAGPADAPDGAVIDEVRLAAAHDGEAELVVMLRFPNGGRARVPLDDVAARHLFDACGASEPDALLGRSWEPVRDALAAASARFLSSNPGDVP